MDVQELGLGCCLNERHLRNGEGLEAKGGLQDFGEGSGKRRCWGNAQEQLRNQMGCEDRLQQVRTLSVLKLGLPFPRMQRTV